MFLLHCALHCVRISKTTLRRPTAPHPRSKGIVGPPSPKRASAVVVHFSSSEAMAAAKYGLGLLRGRAVAWVFRCVMHDMKPTAPSPHPCGLAHSGLAYLTVCILRITICRTSRGVIWTFCLCFGVLRGCAVVWVLRCAMHDMKATAPSPHHCRPAHSGLVLDLRIAICRTGEGMI